MIKYLYLLKIFSAVLFLKYYGSCIHVGNSSFVFTNTLIVLELSFHNSFLESFPDYEIGSKSLLLNAPFDLTPRKKSQNIQ